MPPSITYPTHSHAVLADCAIGEDQDFRTLEPWQVDRLLMHAERMRHKKLSKIDGSLARGFLELLQRRIRSDYLRKRAE